MRPAAPQAVAVSKKLAVHPPPKQLVAHKAVKRVVLLAVQLVVHPQVASRKLVAHPPKQLVAHKAVKAKPSSDLMA